MHAKLKKTRQAGVALLVLLALLITACASQDQAPARKEIGSAESSINQANAGNARQFAPLELRLAEEKLAEANAAFRAEKFVKARNLAEQASADAQLAEAKAQNARTREMVSTLQSSISQLRQEIEHNEAK